MDTVTKPLAATQTVTLDIEPAHIAAPKEFNLRPEKSYGNIEDLAADIKKRGLLNPILVAENGQNKEKPWRLIGGFRRLEAIKMLGLKSVRATVVVGTEEELHWINLVENLVRKDLSTYEIAIACQRLSTDYKLSAQQISARLGAAESLSKAYINHLLQALRQLHPAILKAWSGEMGENLQALCTKAYIEGVMRLPPAEQLVKWETDIGKRSAPKAIEGMASDPAEPETKKPGKSHLVKAVKALSDANINGIAKASALAALRWVTGDAKTLTIDGACVYTTKKVKKAKAAKPSKKAGKAVKANK